MRHICGANGLFGKSFKWTDEPSNFPFSDRKQVNAQPYDSKTAKFANAQAFLNQMESLFALVSDEVSMKGWKHFAWEDHRCREGCRHVPSNADCTWGGIPPQIAFGDVQQLPDVACKAFYDSDPAYKLPSACSCGCLAMGNYLEPSPESND
jgi:hypothetical protein